MSDERRVLEHALALLHRTNRMHVAMKSEERKSKRELRSLTSKKHALGLYVDHLQTQNASAIAAFEASVSARDAAKSDAEKYKELYKKAAAACRVAQRIAENKEKDIAIIMGERPGGSGSIVHRLDDAPMGKEMKEVRSISVSVASSQMMTPVHPPRAIERQQAVGPGAMSQAPTTDKDLVGEARESALLGWRRFTASKLDYKISERRRRGAHGATAPGLHERRLRIVGCGGASNQPGGHDTFRASSGNTVQLIQLRRQRDGGV